MKELRTLIVGPVPDDFHPDRHVPLSPACFAGREQIFPSWDVLEFAPDPFPTPDALADACRRTGACANALLPSLARDLNALAGSERAEVYWRILLMPWLLTVVQTTWERQVRVQQFIERHGETPFAIRVVGDDITWDFRDTLDFINRGVLHPAYNEWLCSRLIEALRPAQWRLEEVRPAAQPKAPVAPPPPSPIRGLKESWRSRLRCNGVYGVGWGSAIALSAYLALKPLQRTDRVRPDPVPDGEGDLPWAIDLRRLLQRTIPSCFQDAAAARSSTPRARRDRIRVIGPRLWYDESDKRQLASAVEAGERLAVTQHGGYYGTALSGGLIPELEYRHDAFLTWGWEAQADYVGNFVPLPSPMLSKTADGHASRRHELLLVGAWTSLYSYRLDSTPQAWQQLEYRRWKGVFVRRLDGRIVERLRYRPYPSDMASLEDGPHFARAFPQIPLLGGDLHERLLTCRLAAIDHPGTTLLVALSANVPTVAFWDGRAWASCRQAHPHFEALKACGVLFDSPDEAARQVNAVFEQSSVWWRDPAIQRARRAWCERYARTSRWWWGPWLRALWRL